jgi:hypothetical protein
MSTFRKIALAAALSAVALTSIAGVRATHTRAGNFLFAGTALVPLNAANQTGIIFNSPAAGRKVLTFSAECAVDAPAGNTITWLDIDVIVNGVAVSPTAGNLDAFCSGAGAAGPGDAWVRPSITVVIPVVGGNNSVRIQARANNGAAGGWIGDSSLVVHD